MIHEVDQLRPLTGVGYRLLRTPTICLAVAISLLVFPSGLLWMVAFWLAVYSVILMRGGKGALPLAICLVVLVIKRPDWAPWLIVLSCAMFAALAMQPWSSRMKTTTVLKGRWIVVVSLWILWIAAYWKGAAAVRCGRTLIFDSNRPIVCLGDSLTTGLSDEEAYPEYLQQLVKLPVINMARPGITAQVALVDLPRLREANPQLVVIELGGHDFLRGHKKAATRKVLEEIINTCRQIGAKPLLFEIPRGFITDGYSGLERGLAREYDLELIEDSAIRRLVIQSSLFPGSGLLGPALSDDGLHPNRKGAEHLAQAVDEALVRLYGSAINRQE